MRTLKTFTFYLLCALFISGIAFPSNLQAQNKKTEAADLAFKNHQYLTAVKKYKRASRKIKDKDEKNRIAFQIAECYRMTNNVRLAAPAYKRLINLKYNEKEPLVLLYYADLQRLIEKYDIALEYYNQFLQAVPDDKKGLAGKASCEIAGELLSQPSRHSIEAENAINTRFDDFSATYANAAYSEVIFTSSRDGAKSKLKDEWTGRAFSDLWIVKKDVKGKWGKPVLADEAEVVNTDANEGQPFFNPRFNAMYFTRCPNEKKKQNGCQILVSKRAGKGFSEAVGVELSTDSTIAIGHPTLASDELTIIFSSDMPGGLGGKDLWIATRQKKNDKFGRARNLGEPINTPGNEVFPFLRNDTMLYFASDGHPGLGGLDIFKSTMNNSTEKTSTWTPPINMGIPINSSSDDFAITFHPESYEEGLFSSNRKGGRGGDDIYSFSAEPVLFTLQGVVKDELSLQFIQNALVSMKRNDNAGFKSSTSARGTYSFNKNQMKPNFDFDLTVSADGYFSKTGKTTTKGYENSKDLVLDFILTPIPKKPIVLPEILYDLGKWDLKPQYQDSLQGLITTLDANPTIIVELAAHTDARDSEDRNDILSQKRAQSVVDYLIVRGIDGDRLKAKGYGERAPRLLLKDFVRAGFKFRSGTRLTESYIDSLPSREVKEAAHQLNRRSEFSIIATNFVPKAQTKTSTGGIAPKVDIILEPERNMVRYTISARGNRMVLPCAIEGFSTQFVYDANYNLPVISMEMALSLLKNAVITKDNFQGNAEEILADGQIKKNSILTLPSVKIGKKVIYDIDVVVETKLEEGLILNRSTLAKYGAFTIDEQSQTIIFE
ncbi:MAG: OmpA family protein [Bacteroidales bacterium]|nr:OmpA family protein [Bacteroidales bacterium]